MKSTKRNLKLNLKSKTYLKSTKIYLKLKIKNLKSTKMNLKLIMNLKSKTYLKATKRSWI